MNLPHHRRLTKLHLSVLFTASSSRANGHRQWRRNRQLTPIPEAAHRMAQTRETSWHREFESAQQFIRRRRQRRRLGQRLLSSECLSPLQRWFVTNIESIPSYTWDSVEQYNITALAYLYKHYVQRKDGKGEYFGAYGERTNEMKENHQLLGNFWYGRNATETERGSNLNWASEGDSIASSAAAQHHYLTSAASGESTLILLGMHGDDLSSQQVLIPTLQQVYSLDPASARSLAGEIQSIIEELPGKYTNPLLTSNAIATQSSVSGSQERDTIIVGDGVFTFLEWLELSADGPDFIHSHEFAHHVQYDMGEQSLGGGGVGDDGSPGSTAEQTRRLELMADVFGSYYAAHKLGGGMDSERLYEIHRTAFSLGDCESADGTHHGTPRQRECASYYGANLALPSYADGGYRLSPEELRGMFDEKYDAILALDEEECTPVVDQSTLDKAIYGEEFDEAEVPFYGDDGFAGSSVGSIDSAPSYLEPVVSWFDPKPANYYDTEESSLLSGSQNQHASFTSESVPTNSQGNGLFEPYESFETSSQENNEWVSEVVPTEEELDTSPQIIQNKDNDEEEKDEGDNWFDQTKWFVGQTFSISSSVNLSASSFSVSISVVVVLMLL